MRSIGLHVRVYLASATLVPLSVISPHQAAKSKLRRVPLTRTSAVLTLNAFTMHREFTIVNAIQATVATLILLTVQWTSTHAYRLTRILVATWQTRVHRALKLTNVRRHRVKWSGQKAILGPVMTL